MYKRRRKEWVQVEEDSKGEGKGEEEDGGFRGVSKDSSNSTSVTVCSLLERILFFVLLEE